MRNLLSKLNPHLVVVLLPEMRAQLMEFGYTEEELKDPNKVLKLHAKVCKEIDKALA